VEDGNYEWVPGHWERAKANVRWYDGRWEQRGNVWVFIQVVGASPLTRR